MGSRYVDAVLYGLKGRELSLSRKNGKPKKLTAQDMAFLLTIAARQPNPTAKLHDGLDPICYGDPETLQELMHLKKTAFFETRNFLQSLQLISFSAKEKRPRSRNGGADGWFTNVYRINLSEIRKFWPNIDDWKKLLHIGEEKDRDVLHALVALEGESCPVRNAESSVRHAENPVRHAENRVRNADTNTKRENITQHHQTNQVDGGVVDEDYLNRVIERIKGRLPDYTGPIIRATISKAIAGKFPDSVYAAIENATGVEQVGGFVTLLRGLPPQEEDKNFKERDAEKREDYFKEASMDAKTMVLAAIEVIGSKEITPTLFKKLIKTLEGFAGDSDLRGRAMTCIKDRFKREKGESPDGACSRLIESLENEKKN